MPEEGFLENYTRYTERKALYKSFGYDVDSERAFILEKAQPLHGEILEAGTGKGHFALTLAKAGYRFTTFDISETEQAFAKLTLAYFKLDKQVDFRIEDGERLSFKDQSFDSIFSVNTLHHLKNPYRFIDELTRVLSFKGKIILSDFTKEGLQVIDKIHALEGQKHQAGSVTLQDTRHYLEGKKFQTQAHQDTYQEIIVANRQII
ncbi:MAG: class I SAM-dependent methyltransferase [Candidatus Omnitrophica bacterium]|nr:class I SAM-dependent methyltransferase [Candidatus Omnitrophota bacterium]